MTTYRLYCSRMGIRPYVVIDAATAVQAVEKYVDDHIRIYDADECGDQTQYFAVASDGQTSYYRVVYSWYIDWNPEWQLIDSVEIEQVTNDQTWGLIGDRDWINVGSMGVIRD